MVESRGQTPQSQKTFSFLEQDILHPDPQF